jgi:hypothetical protein
MCLVYRRRSGTLSNGSIVHIAVGMARQGYDLQITRYDEAGGAIFYTSGMDHSPPSATGTGWDRTPSRVCCSG